MAFGTNDLAGRARRDWHASRNLGLWDVRLPSRLDIWRCRISRFCSDAEAMGVVHFDFRPHCVVMLGMFMAIFITLLLETALANRYFHAHCRSGGFGRNNEFPSSSLRDVQLVPRDEQYVAHGAVLRIDFTHLLCRVPPGERQRSSAAVPQFNKSVRRKLLVRIPRAPTIPYNAKRN